MVGRGTDDVDVPDELAVVVDDGDGDEPIDSDCAWPAPVNDANTNAPATNAIMNPSGRASNAIGHRRSGLVDPARRSAMRPDNPYQATTALARRSAAEMTSAMCRPLAKARSAAEMTF